VYEASGRHRATVHPSVTLHGLGTARRRRVCTYYFSGHMYRQRVGVSKSTKANTLRASAKRALQWVVGLKSARWLSRQEQEHCPHSPERVCPKRTSANTHPHSGDKSALVGTGSGIVQLSISERGWRRQHCYGSCQEEDGQEGGGGGEGGYVEIDWCRFGYLAVSLDQRVRSFRCVVRTHHRLPHASRCRGPPHRSAPPGPPHPAH
jgi:hypothetical protein